MRLTDICPILPSDLQVIKGDTWIHISPMGKIQLYPHRWKDRGNTGTGSLVLCRILSTRTELGMLTELGLESRIKEESLRFESWWYLGVGQMVHKVKIKVLVGLSSKIKKIPRKRFFRGKIFFLFFEIFQLTVLLFSFTIMTSTAANRLSAKIFISRGNASTSCHGKDRVRVMFHVIWPAQSEIKILPGSWW